MKKIREVRLTNTLTGKKEVFKPIEPGKVTFYSCGPTVYNFIHIGNLRTALASDLFHRYFKKIGYDVRFARNYTDVDDRIIQKANEEGVDSRAVSERFTDEVERDYRSAGMLTPTMTPKATEFIPEMIEMIQTLVDKGNAYVLPSGEVVYSIESFKEYGKLSGRDVEDLIAGSRVEVNAEKKNPLDFTLWKPAKPGEPKWPSPWCEGRPGWHIECSVMSKKCLGEKIDVHHGGLDLVFPHHENEIAQSEAANGCAPFAAYWLHSGMLTLAKQKMSKSLGNIFLAREFLETYSSDLTRFLFLSVHYRALLEFSDETISQALDGLQRIYEAKQKALDLMVAEVTAAGDSKKWQALSERVSKAAEEIDENLANDFNTAGALGVLFSLIRELNRVSSETSSVSAAAVEFGKKFIDLLENDVGTVFGFGLASPKEAFAEIARMRKNQLKSKGTEALDESTIQKLIEERQLAKKAKNFARADEIRNELQEKGVLLKDSPTGTTWEYS